MIEIYMRKARVLIYTCISGTMKTENSVSHTVFGMYLEYNLYNDGTEE